MKNFPIEEIISSFEQTLSPERQQELEKWISHSTKNKQKYQELKKIYKVTGKVQSNLKIDEYQALRKVNKKISRRYSIRIIPKAAAAVILIFLIAKSIFLLFPSIHWQKIETNKKQIVYLPDSSKVVLASNSLLKFPAKFASNKRTVYLKGKAYFEITHHPKRPFEITTPNTKVQDLGTRFLLDASNPQQEQVAVDAGKVAYQALNKADSHTTILTKQEVGTWNSANGKIQKTIDRELNRNAYLSGRLIFKNTPIPKVIQVLESFYHIKVIIANEIDNKLTLSTSFNNSKPEEVLQVLAATLNLTVEKSGNQYTLKS